MGDLHFVFGGHLAFNFSLGYDQITKPVRLFWGWRSGFVKEFVTPGLPPLEDDFFWCGGHIVIRQLCECFPTFLNTTGMEPPSLCPNSLEHLGVTPQEVSNL